MTLGVVQVMFDEMVKLSPVKLQVWVVEFCEWEQAEQDFPHFLNPTRASLQPYQISFKQFFCALNPQKTVG